MKLTTPGRRWPRGVAGAGRRRLRQQRRQLQHRGSGGARASGTELGGTHQRRRRHVPAARLPGVGRRFKEQQGTHRQLPGHRLGRRHRPVHRRHRRLRRHRLGDEGRGDHGRQEEGRAGPRPDRVRRGHRLLQRRRASTRASSSTARRSPTSSSARSRSGTTRRSRSSTPASTCRHRRSRSATAPTSRARRSSSPRSSPTTRRSGRTAPASTRRSSGRPAPAPRATTASPPASSRPTARSATSSRPTRCRTTSPTPRQEQVRQVRRADARVDLGRRRRAQGPGRPALQRRSTRRARRPTRSPRPTFLLVYQDMCKAGLSEDKAKRVKAWLDYALGDGQERRQGAPVRAAARRHQDQGPGRRSTACSATARR